MKEATVSRLNGSPVKVLSLGLFSLVLLRLQHLTNVREPSTKPEMGMDPESLQVFRVLCALHQGNRSGVFPHRRGQVSWLVFNGCYKVRWNLWLSAMHFTALC